MSDTPDFEGFLSSKKIDCDAFRSGEPEVWKTWKMEYDQMHPASFVVQKLNLINPVRRKYPLRVRPDPQPADLHSQTQGTPAPVKPARPVIRPKTG